MSEPVSAPTITEREAVERERAAFIAGCMVNVDYVVDATRIVRRVRKGEQDEGADLSAVTGAAAQIYPLPKVKRPRVVQWTNEYGDTIEFCATAADQLKFRNASERKAVWERVQVSGWTPNAAMFALWADLLANPTEEVES